MNKALLATTVIALGCVSTLASARPPHGGAHHAGPHHIHRPYYPVVRPVYPGWRASYWAPRAGIYIGAPAYWAGWPYGWGASYSVPYAMAPLVVNAAPAPQVIVQPAPQMPADSYWYYCAQPAGYFPYVQSCTQQWMKVVPQVPGGNDAPPQLAP